MTNPLTNKNRVLIGSYVHVPNFLNFDMDDIVSFDNNFCFFFLFLTLILTQTQGVFGLKTYVEIHVGKKMCENIYKVV